MVQDVIDKLTDQQAIEVVQYVIQEWVKRSGLDALSTWQQLQRATVIAGADDSWVMSATNDAPGAPALSRKILSIFLDSARPDLIRWTREGLDRANEVRANALDPVTLSLVGMIAIGLVLAARIKGINRDGVIFYQGIPDGLSKVIKLVLGPPT